MAHQFQYDIWSRGRAGAGLSTLIAIAPPLWFAEGMAEYLSLGPINPETAMWLRDASLEGKLPTIEQMTAGSRTSTSPIASATRSGPTSASAGATRRSAPSSRPRSRAGSSRRSAGPSASRLEQLSDQWRDAVQKRYLPEIGARAKARAVADELLTEKRSEGTLHLAPALSPDGSQVAYFSEKDFYFVDLYLADGTDRQGQAPDPQVRRQQQLRDLPVHQLPGQLVARREVSGLRGQARRRGTTSSSWTSRATSRSGGSSSS